MAREAAHGDRGGVRTIKTPSYGAEIHKSDGCLLFSYYALLTEHTFQHLIIAKSGTLHQCIMSDDDQSLPSIELRSLHRNSTIESGRQLEAVAKEPKRRGALSRKLGFFAGRTDSHQDAIQEMFASAISEIENVGSTHQAPDLQYLRRLSKDYSKFKERPAVLCHRFFSYWNFATTTQDVVSTRK